MIVVLDTNVLVSGLIVAVSPSGRIVDMLRTGDIQLAVDDRILAEYEEVLARPRFNPYFTAEDVYRVMGFIRADSVRVVCSTSFTDLPDPKDAPFAETALVAKAPLVTGNIKHFPAKLCREIRVITPAQFAAEFQSDQHPE